MESTIIRSPLVEVFILFFVAPFLRRFAMEVLKRWEKLLGVPLSEEEREARIESIFKMIRDYIFK